MADGKVVIDAKFNKDQAQKDAKSFQKSIERIGKKAQSVGKNLTKYVSAPLAALGTAAFAAANEMDKAYKDIQTGTGATGEALNGLKNDFRTVFEGVPNSANEVAGALTNLNTLTGATDSTLQNLTTSVLDASRSLGEDGVANSQLFGQAMQQWQRPAEEGPAILDSLFVATQDYGVGLGQITSHLTEYGSVLKNAGFTMEESADLFGRLEASGLSVSRVMPGLNMAFRNWAAEGKNSREEFNKTIQKMQEAETETEALSIATEQFGAEGAQRLTTAIRNGAIPSLDELGAALEGSEGAVQKNAEQTMTLGEKWAQLKNQAMVSLEPIGRIILNVAENALPPLLSALESAATWFSNLSPAVQQATVIIGALAAALGPVITIGAAVINTFINLYKNIKPIFPILKKVATALRLGPVLTALTGPVGIVIGILAALGAALVVAYQKSETFRNIVNNAWQSIQNAWTATMDFFTVTLPQWVNNIITWFRNLWTQAQAVFTQLKVVLQTIWNGIKSAIMAVVMTFVNQVKLYFNNMKSGLTQIMTGLSNFFSGIWQAIKNIFLGAILLIVDLVTGDFESMKSHAQGIMENLSNALSQIWQGIKQIFSGALDALLGYVQTSWNVLKSTTTNIFSSVSSFISSTWQSIKSGVSNAVSNILSTVSNTFSNMVSAVQNKMQSVKTKITNIWNEAKSFLSGIDLTSIGRDIIQGLINGIGSMASRVWGKVQEIADGIKGKIEGILGIASPSKELMEIGEYTGEGLEIGLDKQIPNIIKKAEQMASASMPELGPAPMVEAAGNVAPVNRDTGNGNRSATINQNVYGVQPGDVQRETQRALRRTATEWAVN